MTPRLVVTLYGKPGCHLCEELRERLEALRDECAFTVEEIDITKDPVLFDRYRYAIPVLWVDGVEIGRGRIDQAQLAERLRGVG